MGLLERLLERCRPVRLVHVEDQAARRGRDCLVVEDRDAAIGPSSGVVLPAECNAGAEREIALPAAQPPVDLAGHAVDLVDGRGVPGRDDEVAVGVDLDRVRVVGVEGVGWLRGCVNVGLGRIDVLGGVPLEDQLSAGDVDLLHDVIPECPRSTPGRIWGHGVAGEEERRPGRRDLQLVKIQAVPVDGLDAGDLDVARVGDDVIPVTIAAIQGAFPPRQHRRSLVREDTQIS